GRDREDRALDRRSHMLRDLGLEPGRRRQPPGKREAESIRRIHGAISLSLVRSGLTCEGEAHETNTHQHHRVETRLARNRLATGIDARTGGAYHPAGPA